MRRQYEELEDLRVADASRAPTHQERASRIMALYPWIPESLVTDLDGKNVREDMEIYKTWGKMGTRSFSNVIKTIS